MFFRRIKKPVLIFILCVFISLNALLLVPQKAQAQFVVSVPNLESMSIREWIMDALMGLLKGVLFQGLMNALQYFLQKLAYDAAVWIASGGKGQGTLFEYKSYGDYFTDIAFDTAGEFLGSLSEDWPIDICAPTFDVSELLPEITMNIQLGIADTQEPRPRCRWNELMENWDQFINENNTVDVLREYGRSLQPGEGGLGSVLSLTDKMQTEISEKQEAGAKDREESGGFKSVTQKVSGYIETPGAFVKESVTQKLVDQPQKGQEQQLEGSFSFKDSLITMGLNIGSMFLNTLTQNLFSNIMGGFFKTGDLVSDKGSLWDLGVTTTEPSGGRIAAEAIFAELLTPQIMEVTNYNPLSEFTACPTPRSSLGCAMDASFSAAITQTASGDTVTIKDAIKKGFLHANWPLIPLADKSRNQDPNCYTYGYCYSNLVKLRKHRIISIGWELAANSPANDIGNPVTLGEVVSNFNNSGPYYHLINPDWILKFPLTQCKLKVNGPRLMANEGDMREQVCADTPSCVKEDNDGKCLGAWGYCTREENIWRMTADECPSEYSSCETMVSREGKQISYLRNTLDYGECNAGNVGCLWYSASKKDDDSWNKGNRIYLNKNAEQCDAGFAGCTDLIKKERGISANFIQNSSFESGDGMEPDNWIRVFPVAKNTQPKLFTSIKEDNNSSRVYAALIPGIETVHAAANLPPVAVISGLSEIPIGYVFEASVGSETFFNGRGSYDTDGSIKTYRWELSGPKTSSGSSDIFSYTWLTAGSYTLTLTVTDNLGATDSLAMPISVTERTFIPPTAPEEPTVNQPPSAMINFSIEGRIPVGTTVMFDGNSSSDSDGTISAYLWKVNDLKYTEGTGKIYSFTFNEIGKSTVSLTVTDNEGATDTAYLIIIVEDVTSPALTAPLEPEPSTCFGFDIYSADGNKSYHGAYAINSCARNTQRNISLPAGAYTLSAHAKQAVLGGNDSATIKVIASRPEYISHNDCIIQNNEVILRFTPGDSYERKECVFFINQSDIVDIEAGGGGLVWIDAIQLEEGVNTTSYREAGYPYNAEHVFMRKAPDYLGCTGDIVKDNYECFNYARVCSFEDVGCELFTPVNGDPSIAAITSAEDMCPAECAGYDLFRQGETNFEGEDPAVFLIPQNSQECSFDVAGCDEFTNTETSAVSYYTFLRQCSDNFDESATYYTWEGSDTTGYQLKSWQLLRGSPLVGELGNPPAYQGGFEDYGACNEEVFRSGANPDCREFYDEIGNITYRLYSKTIVVTEECEELRRASITEDLAQQETDCSATGGAWIESGCLYYGYPPESLACGAQYKGCRAYTGSVGRNFRVLFNDTFEGGDSSGWEGNVRVSTESLQVGGHSLRVTNTNTKDVADIVKKGGVYTLSFWAKGPISNLVILFTSASSASLDGSEIYFSSFDSPRVTLATEWRYYNLGPVYFDRPPAEDEFLRFIALQAGRTGVENMMPMSNTYFDNIILKEVVENIYLIKNSWYIPRSCDMTINGAPLPQAMVGCQEYKDRKNITRYLKSFTRLCGENMVGCEAFINTQNSNSSFREIWDMGIEVVDSEVVSRIFTVPADETVYLVNDEQFFCTQNEVGCSKVGYPKLTRTEKATDEIIFEDKFLKIKPNQFENQLCKTKELFCEEYRTENSGLLYFKEPRDRSCEFRDTDEISGWFRKGTNEACAQLEPPARVVNMYKIQRNADEHYDGWVGMCDKKWSGCTTLVDVEDISPDYPDGKPYYYLRNEQLDTKSCKGQVSRIDGCVLFHDLNDPAFRYRADATYIKSRDEASGGKVSAVNCPLNSDDCKKCRESISYLEITGGGEGVISFMDVACGTDADCPDNYEIINPDGSREIGEYSCRTPDREQDLTQNDSNLIVKVRPDRICGEWLTCRSSVTVWDEAAGRDKKICTAVDLCSEFETTGEQEAKCVRFVSGDNEDTILDIESYITRDTSWSGMEYSGYSIPNQYQMADLEAIDVEGEKRLVVQIGFCSEPGRMCGEGRCFESRCLVGIDGSRPPSFLYSPQAKRSVVARSCRAYPEQTSPFPITVAEWDRYLDEEQKGAISSKKQGFTGAQVCEKYAWLDGDMDNQVDFYEDVNKTELYFQNCECSYKKAIYGKGTLTKYFSYEQEFMPEGICFGGLRDGLPCNPGTKETCGPQEEGGTCERMTRADKFLGLEGYCLEYDYSMSINASKDEYPCLTWRPVEIPEGGQDVYNQHDSAGYNPPTAGVGKYFCLNGKGNANIEDPHYSTMSMSRTNPLDCTLFTLECRADPGCVFTSRGCESRTNCSSLSRSECIDTPRCDFDLSSEPNCESKVVPPINYLGGTGSIEVDDYGEKFYPRVSDVPVYKEDIAGIVLTPISNYTDLPNLGGPDDAIDDLDFTKDKKNILSRLSKHNGSFVTPERKEYTYWEVRWPDTKDGIEDWNSGKTTLNTSHPLFIMPWVENNFDEWIADARDGGVDSLTDYTTFLSESSSGISSCSDGRTLEAINKNGDKITGNYAAVRAVFDDNDEFLGFWTILCDASSDKGNIRFSAEFLKTEMCMYLVQVIDSDGHNTAMTNDIWKLSDTQLNPISGITNPNPSIVEPNTNYDFKFDDETCGLVSEEERVYLSTEKYTFNQSNAPFGSSANGFKNPETEQEPWFISAESSGSPYFTTDYFSQSAVDAGSPLGCRLGAEKEVKIPESCYYRIPADSLVRVDRRQGCYLEDTTIPLNSYLKTAQEELQKIFAKSYNVYVWHVGESRKTEGPGYKLFAGSVPSSLYETSINIPLMWDKTTTDNPLAAMVNYAAPDPDTGDEIINKINVNNHLDGILKTNNTNFEAVIRVYAWANSNQMPLISRWVQWGDYTPIEKYFGKYKNHRKNCAATPELADNFGVSPEACAEDYFEFSHTYICNDEMINEELNSPDLLPVCKITPVETGTRDWDISIDNNEAGYEAIYPTPCRLDVDPDTGIKDFGCVFKPSIRITDNWGWCTGTRETCDTEELDESGRFYGAPFNGFILLNPAPQ